MDPRILAFGLAFLAMVNSVRGDVNSNAAEIADSYFDVMKAKSYPFLSNEILRQRRRQVKIFVLEHLDRPLKPEQLVTIKKGIRRCLERLYSSPADQIVYGNGFGSGGVEWMYLNDPDYFQTFQFHLWIALTQPEVTIEQLSLARNQQRWMRDYLKHLPIKDNHPFVDELGKQELRDKVLDDFDRMIHDPLHLLSRPFSKKGFDKLQDRFRRFSNGVSSDLHEMEVAALTSWFPSERDPSGRLGYRYEGTGPFDGTVVSIWGNGPSLVFAGNLGHRGHHGTVGKASAYDVVSLREIRPAEKQDVPFDRWLSEQDHGDLCLVDDQLTGCRGALFAVLEIKNWFDADALSTEAIRAMIDTQKLTAIRVNSLPPMNGPHRSDRSEGEMFIAVENRDGAIAVINLHNYEFGQLSLWCRTRSEKQIAE